MLKNQLAKETKFKLEVVFFTLFCLDPISFHSIKSPQEQEINNNLEPRIKELKKLIRHYIFNINQIENIKKEKVLQFLLIRNYLTLLESTNKNVFKKFSISYQRDTKKENFRIKQNLGVNLLPLKALKSLEDFFSL